MIPKQNRMRDAFHLLFKIFTERNNYLERFQILNYC